ncbi:MAG: NAD(P)-binding oxidoreductase [Halobellus sp.]|uniref:NAD(P)-binding oxidoreductase n=1 Tax=Halobellus sp. TaxID=1979212 RepID=UPI0035D4ABFC
MHSESLDTVLVAGATGGTGRAVLRLAQSRVDTVRALTRSPDAAPDLEAAGADEVVVDDLLDPDDLSAVVAGTDAVLSAVGTSPVAIRSGPPFVDGAGNRALVTAAADADVESFVMESAIGVGPEPASPLATAFDAFIGPLQKAKASAEASIRDAPLRHTILRPGVLTNGSRTDVVTAAEPGAKLWGLISRADVARLMLAAPLTPDARDRTLEVVSTPQFDERAAPIDWTLPR